MAVELLFFQTDSLESAHLALEVERRAYQELFGSGPDGFLVTDPEGIILRANLRARELFRCPPEDLVGQPFPTLVHPGDRRSLETVVEGLASGTWDSKWIGSALRAAGDPFRTAVAVRHADSGVYRVQWALRDISRCPWEN